MSEMLETSFFTYLLHDFVYESILLRQRGLAFKNRRSMQQPELNEDGTEKKVTKSCYFIFVFIFNFF